VSTESTVVPVLPSARAWSLHDLEASRRIEHAALRNTAPHALMQRAGFAVARLAVAVAPGARRVWVAAGPGNNGGDGLVVARHLHQLGWSVRVSLLAAPEALPDDARDAHAQALQAGVSIEPGLPSSVEFDLCIDALLGLGGRRRPSDAIAAAIRRMNDSGAPILAIDLPSGLSATTGCLLGEVAVRATHTLSLLTLKPGLFTAHGRDHCGRVWLDGLGVDTGSEPPSARLAGPAARRPRAHAQHKGSFGDVAVVGGATGMSGAAMLASRAALAAGAGRVYVVRLDGRLDPDPLRPELMPRTPADMLQPDRLAQATVVGGCGGGDAVREHLPVLLHHAARLVLDADALNAVAAEPALRAALRARQARGRRTIATPHPLEAARLLALASAEVQDDRLAHAGSLAEQLQCTVVLKGSGTIVATPGEPVSINPTGNARLGSAGSGDVLAGWLGGLWAQHPGQPAQRLASDAVWLHGRAAESGDPAQPLLAGDLIDAMVRAQANA